MRSSLKLLQAVTKVTENISLGVANGDKTLGPGSWEGNQQHALAWNAVPPSSVFSRYYCHFKQSKAKCGWGEAVPEWR